MMRKKRDLMKRISLAFLALLLLSACGRAEISLLLGMEYGEHTLVVYTLEGRVNEL